jgi:hypothetical protein
MAKIVFLTNNLPSSTDLRANTVYRLVKHLADQQHDITLVTSFLENQELPPSHTRIEIIRPFQSWNWLEVLKSAPFLHSLHPDIFHTVQLKPSGLFPILHAKAYTPLLMSSMGPAARVFSFLDGPKHLQLDPLTREMVENANAVTVCSTEQETWIKEKVPIQILDKVELLPLDELLHEVKVESTDIPFQKYMVTPGPMNLITDTGVLLDRAEKAMNEHEDWGWVLAGSWGDWSLSERKRWMMDLEERNLAHRFFVTDLLHEGQIRDVFRKASQVLFGSLDRTTFEWGYYSSLARVLDLKNDLEINEHEILMCRLDPGNFLSRLYQKI